MFRDDFKILDDGLIYFDNAATTLKPNAVVDSIVSYYTEYTANCHRGDYANSLKVDLMFEGTRKKVQEFIHSEKMEEIVFTKGSTESLNLVVFGFMAHVLQKGDEVLLTRSEHASNILPWMVLEKEKGIVIRYIPLTEDYEVTMDNIRSVITDKTKVIALSHVTNSVGDVRPIHEIGSLCKEKNIYFVVDATQSIGHFLTDVTRDYISFLAFSAHKMLGPTGVGVLYGKFELLNQLIPTEYGGGMNSFFYTEEEQSKMELKELPHRLEAGTPNIAGVIGLGAAIDYLQKVGLNNIHNYEVELKKYLVSRLEEVPNITIYNKKSDSGLLIFNIKDFFSQDVAIFLDKYRICVRAGNHCAKMLKDVICTTNTCRVSLYFYNTKEEIDKLVEVLKMQDHFLDTII